MIYKHLSIQEREKIAIYRAQGLSLCQVAKLLGRDKATISRELKRNSDQYLPSKAQAKLVKRLFLGLHWSPEQISVRLKRASPAAKKVTFPIAGKSQSVTNCRNYRLKQMNAVEKFQSY